MQPSDVALCSTATTHSVPMTQNGDASPGGSAFAGIVSVSAVPPWTSA